MAAVVAPDINPKPEPPKDNRMTLFRQFGFGQKTRIPFGTVHEAFIHHATQAPSEVALVDLSPGTPKEVTYGELLRQAQFIATQLRANGVIPGHRVMLLVKRSAEMVAGILGILMAGAQYIPMDGGVVPDHTLQHAVEQSSVTVVLCLHPFEERIQFLGTVGVSVLVLDDLLQSPAFTDFAVDQANLLCEGNKNSGCYLIYTSGEFFRISTIEVYLISLLFVVIFYFLFLFFFLTMQRYNRSSEGCLRDAQKCDQHPLPSTRQSGNDPRHKSRAGAVRELRYGFVTKRVQFVGDTLWGREKR